MSNTNKKKVANFSKDTKVKATVQKRRVSGNVANEPLLFNQESYKWVLLGVALIILGMFLMMGGHMPSNDVWDDSLIYSWRRTLLAPIVILAGLIVEVYAILKK